MSDEAASQRRSIRIESYDYTQAGAYFVTICADGKANLFGEVASGDVRLSRIGQIVETCWCEIPRHFEKATLDAFVVMPDHFHGIVLMDLEEDSGETTARHVVPLRSQGEAFGRPVRGSLATIVRSFKGAVTRKARQRTDRERLRVRQRNYYEHVIRSGRELALSREYILGNPYAWSLGHENSESPEWK